MRGAPVERDAFDAAVRAGIDLAARGFVHPAALHADEAVLDEIEAADAMLAAKLIERGEQRGGRHRLAVERGAVALLEVDGDVFGLVRRILGIDRAAVDVVRRLLPRILEHFAFGGGVEEVRVGRERAFAALVLGDGDLMLFGPCDQCGAAGQIPFAPRGDDLDARLQRIGGKFKAHLIVALAGSAVGDSVGTGLAGDLDEALGNERPGDRGAEQVIAFVAGIGAHHREHEIAHEFLAQVVDVDVLGLDAHQLGLGAGRGEFFTLAEIGGERHYLAAVGHLQPLEDDAGIETAGVGEDDALDFRHGSQLPVDRYRMARRLAGPRARCNLLGADQPLRAAR